MAKQDYILKKYVRAETAIEAAGMDRDTPVSEIFLAAEKPTVVADGIGFKTVDAEDLYELRHATPKRK